MIKKYSQLRLFVQITILASLTIILFTGFILFYSNQTEKIYKNKSTDYTNDIVFQLKETIASNHSSLSKILQFVTFHIDVQEFLCEENEDARYRYYRQMHANLSSIMSLNPYILDIVIEDSFGNLYSLVDSGYELPINYRYDASLELSPLLHYDNEGDTYFVMHYPIYSILSHINENLEIGNAYLVLDDTAFLDQSDHNYSKTSSSIYLMDNTYNLFWSNSSEELPSIDELRDAGYETTVEEATGLIIGSVLKQEAAIYSLLGIQNSYRYILLLMLAVLLILWILMIINIVSPLNELFLFISSISKGGLNNLKERVHLKGYKEITIISEETNQMLEQIDSLTNTVLTTHRHIYDIELQKKQAELLHLRSQINPHFLYNTLECIKGIAAEHKQPDIVNVTKSLATIFKYSIKGNDKVPFKDELKIVKNYISIQKVRFDDRFYLEYNINPYCYDVIIPKMILQPIVENAIVHGIESSIEPSRLKVSAYYEADRLIIEVNNTGSPIHPDTLQRLQQDFATFVNEIPISRTGSIGMHNVNDRIKLTCGDEFGLSIKSIEDSSTSVTISLPLNLLPEDVCTPM